MQVHEGGEQALVACVQLAAVAWRSKQDWKRTECEEGDTASVESWQEKLGWGGSGGAEWVGEWELVFVFLEKKRLVICEG